MCLNTRFSFSPRYSLIGVTFKKRLRELTFQQNASLSVVVNVIGVFKDRQLLHKGIRKSAIQKEKRELL